MAEPEPEGNADCLGRTAMDASQAKPEAPLKEGINFSRVRVYDQSWQGASRAGGLSKGLLGYKWS